MNATSSCRVSIDDFEAGNLDPGLFDHRAHVYVAWSYVQRYGLATALAQFDVAIKRLVVKLGATDKYHSTVTWFFLLLINERSEPGESWESFCERNPDLIADSKALLSQYYSDDYLYSDRARERFLLPNKSGASDG